MNKITQNILVLDDDSFMLSLIAHMLENQGCTNVSTCTSGWDALDIVDSKDERPDLIFLDLNLPGMDGMEFARRLVERNYRGSLVLLSGEDESLLRASEKLVRTHNIPIMGSFQKPLTAEMLSSILAAFAKSHQVSIPVSRQDLISAEELRAAIANGEMVNYYQPKVSLISGEVVGVEALTRWRRPGNEMIFPNRFLGVAESFGLIHELTRVVLSNALAQLKKWHEAGVVLQMAVNVSEYNIEALDFASKVSQLCFAAGVAPQDVVLEVSEGWLPMNDLRVPLETLTRLHLKRFRLAIDEFGTGYSTATQLHGLPFEELKMDKSFVTGMSSNNRVRTKYNSNLSIARQLNLKVTAVGVEHVDDWHLLRQTGCDYAQGSFIAGPMPAENLLGWMNDWQLRLRKEQHLLTGHDHFA